MAERVLCKPSHSIKVVGELWQRDIERNNGSWYCNIAGKSFKHCWLEVSTLLAPRALIGL